MVVSAWTLADLTSSRAGADSDGRGTAGAFQAGGAIVWRGLVVGGMPGGSWLGSPAGFRAAEDGRTVDARTERRFASPKVCALKFSTSGKTWDRGRGIGLLEIEHLIGFSRSLTHRAHAPSK